MVRCPGDASVSIALLRRDGGKKQEVDTQEPKEACTEKEDAREQKREDNRSEATGRMARGNGEETGQSYTPTE
ncbi:hypothetical protein NDU88_006383 [Pleurodeles waltl]|uniref:Uncharacterized protein n=1 Tax=Pleurodeles waltl TaxID=8319 RepID=A0AAV7QHE9_PLEWA|nr:hypothetical protein NDU88_006383 [Pleurodeles waltl]